MTLFNKSGSNYFLHNEADLDVKSLLPAGVYVLSFDQKMGFYLTIDDRFKLPSKFYGDAERRAERVINTFKNRPNSTGIILTGEKGSGKTLLSKMISESLIQNDGIPTIIVNQQFYGDSFNKFITAIEQPAFVIFDEFEKVYYEPNAQSQLLTLFDGLFPSKKLFAITTNELLRVSDFMRNRPGRFFYSFNYRGVDAEFIRDYLEDNLNDKTQIESFIRFASVFDTFNFDMLQALVEEMNRYSETVVEASNYVNVAPAYVSKYKYKVTQFAFNNAPEFKPFQFANYGQGINPMISSVQIYDEEGEDSFDFKPADIVSYDNGRVIYKNEDGMVVLEKEETNHFDWKSLM